MDQKAINYNRALIIIHKTNNICTLGYDRDRTYSIVLNMSPYVENQRRERFHGISKIPNSWHKKLSRDLARHGTQHNGKGKSPENGDHPVHH